MKITVIGTGYVGLVHAATCSELGHEVFAYDTDTEKIKIFSSGIRQNIEEFVNEPGLSNIIRETINKYLFFTSELESAVEGADAIFLCLPTPPNNDGSTNLTFYDRAVVNLAKILSKRKDKKRFVLINKSTLPIGTSRHLHNLLTKHRVENFGVCSNPEFLAEGTAVNNARKPDRIVIGCDNEVDFKILRRIYSQFVNHVKVKYVETTPETAEAIKYVANTMLLNYISFWNGVGAKIGEKFINVNINDLRVGVTSDERISTWGSFVSNGAGGSCFGKDIRSLIYQFRNAGIETKLLESSYEVNEYQKIYLIDRAITEAGFDFNNKTVALLGLAFKKQTNDMRDASSIKLIELLLGKGAKKIKAYDPLSIESAKKEFSISNNFLFNKIEYCNNPREALKNSDALIISSDCDEFRGLSSTIQQTVITPYLVVDGRRMISDYQELVNNGFDYLAVGSALLKKYNNDSVHAFA